MKWKLTCFALLFATGSFSQLRDYGKSIEIRPKAGFLIAHRANMNHLVNSHFYSGEIILNFHANGSKYWHKAYKYPTFGLMATVTYNNNRDVLGQAIGIGANVKLPFVNRPKWALNSRLAGGFAYLTKKFDRLENPKNNAIGTYMNLLVILGMDVQFKFKHGFLGLGVDFTHYSNSGTKKPNLGLNIPSVFLNYGIYLKKPEYLDPEFEPAETGWSLLLHGIFSMNTNYAYQTKAFPVFGVNTYMSKRFGEKSGLSTGIDLIYNEANRNFKSSPPDQSFWETAQVGVFTSYDLHVQRFIFYVGMGIYAYNPYNPNGWFFHKLGGRVELGGNFYLNAVVKSHWAKADYFELGFGYQFKLKRK